MATLITSQGPVVKSINQSYLYWWFSLSRHQKYKWKPYNTESIYRIWEMKEDK